MTNSPSPIMDDELLEQLAAIEHERWAHWQEWCHKVLRENNPSPEIGDILERWDRQIESPYDQLSEKEKQSDRDQVMRYWPLIQAHTAKAVQTAELGARISELHWLRTGAIVRDGQIDVKASKMFRKKLDRRICELEAQIAEPKQSSPITKS